MKWHNTNIRFDLESLSCDCTDNGGISDKFQQYSIRLQCELPFSKLMNCISKCYEAFKIFY